MVDTRSNIQLADLNSKPQGRKSFRNIIDRTIGVQFYPPIGSLHYHQLFLASFMIQLTPIVSKKKKSEIKRTKVSSARTRTTKARTDQI